LSVSAGFSASGIFTYTAFKLAAHPEQIGTVWRPSLPWPRRRLTQIPPDKLSLVFLPSSFSLFDGTDVSKISCTLVLSFAPSAFFFLAGLPAGSELMTPAKACRCCAWKVSFGGCGQCGPPFLFMVVAKKV
jgi:hypothetical protein